MSQVILKSGQPVYQFKAGPSDQERQSRRAKRAYVLAVILYTAFFSIWQVDPVPLQVHAMAILVAATCFIPLTRWYARGAQGAPMFELICLSYALQFSAPVYHQLNAFVVFGQTEYLSWDSTFQALAYVEVGMIALIAGYYGLLRTSLARALPQVDLPLKPERRPIYLAIALSVGLIALLLTALGTATTSSTAGAFVSLASNQLNLVIVLLAYQTFSEQPSRPLRLVTLYTVVALAAAVGLTSGLLENAFVPAVLMLVVQWHVRHKVPWRLVVIGLITFVVLSAAKEDYRQVVWYGTDEVTTIDRLSVWAESSQQVVENNLQSDSWTNLQNLVRESFSRFDLLHKFVHVQNMTPRLIPFYEGTTYDYMLIAWIPRVVWPDKPSAAEPNDQLDVDYLLKSVSQIGHGVIGIGQLPEAYANFGLAGIVGVMFIQGLVFSMLNQVLNGPRSEGGRAIYMSLMVFLLNGIGSSLAIWFGSMLQQIIANALILRPFAYGFRTKIESTDDGEAAKLDSAIARRRLDQDRISHLEHGA
jgi:hypothetical protein